MQSSVRPWQGLLSCDLSMPIISAHSSLIADAVMAVSGIGIAEANAASWAKRTSKAPRRSRSEKRRFMTKALSLAHYASTYFWQAGQLGEPNSIGQQFSVTFFRGWGVCVVNTSITGM